MTTLSDLLYVALFAVAFPLWDYHACYVALTTRPQDGYPACSTC